MPDGLTTCPSVEVLANYSLGKLPVAEFSLVDSHLESCPECCRKLQRPPADSFIRNLRNTPSRGGTIPCSGTVPSESNTPLPKRSPSGPTTSQEVPQELTRLTKFEILSNLGQGGMGSVYKARRPLLEDEVALKVMNPDLIGLPDMRHRFLREVRATIQLNHRNIVRAHDAEEVDDLLYLVMEYVEGVNLDRFVKQKGPLPLHHACRFIVQAAEGLQYAHEKKMVHRDIKPANLMVTADKVVKILDFGLVQVPRAREAVENQTRHQMFMGTAEYVSPEQATDARTADIRSDIYSLGCTLYFLMVGEPPFVRASFLDVLLAQVQDAPVPLPQRRPEVSGELWAVVACMLAKDPADRFQTPAEAAQALRPFTSKSGNQRPEARTEPEPQRVNRHARRVRIGLACGALAMLVLASVFVAQFVLKVETPEGIVEVKVDQPGAEVSVVGQELSFRVGEDKELIQIRVVAGKHELLVKKEGFETYTRKFSYKKGKGPLLEVTLIPLPRRPDFQKDRVAPALAVVPINPKEAREHQQRWADRLKTQVVITNSVQMKLVLIPAGSFDMGSDQGDENESPVHRVHITRPYYLGMYEVTQKEYQAITGNNPASTRGDRMPAQMISWEDAVACCKELSRREGKTYRLPTEAEWEFACRAGTKTAWGFGDRADDAGEYAWHQGNSAKATQPVGLKKPNPFGLYDMHGNVWEFCSDWYGAYPHQAITDPRGPSLGKFRVFRGGSHYFPVWESRSSNRPDRQFPPRGGNLGFRMLHECPAGTD